MLIFPDDDMLDRIVSQYVKHRNEFPVRPKSFRLHALFWEYSPEYDEVVYEPNDIDLPWSPEGGRPDYQ